MTLCTFAREDEVMVREAGIKEPETRSSIMRWG